jgi:hypothetical protein
MSMQEPEPPREQAHSLHYFIGLGIGLIPLIVALVAVGNIMNASAGITFTVALGLYAAEFIAMIVCLAISRTRFIGYGLLTMVLAGPVITVISCVVVLTRTS